MSIASRINEMTEHLRNDWDGIDKLGLDITEENSNDNLDKNIENITPVLDRFYNQASDKTNLSENGIVGRTSQETTTGKNLLKPQSLGEEKNGITVSYDRTTQTYTFNGTCTIDNTNFQIGANQIEVTNNVTRVSGHWVDGSVSGYCQMRHYNSDYSKVLAYNLLNLSGINPVSYATATESFTVPQGRSSIRFNNGSIADNLKVKFMVADSLDTSYEPYTGGQPSPSPDFPQEINNLSGDVEYRVRGKNLLPNNANSQTINGVTFTVNEDKSITINGTATANSFFEFFNGNILLGNTITGIRKTTKSSPTQYPRLLLLIGGTEYNVDNIESHRNYRVFTGGGTLTRAGIGILNGETYNETLYCMIVNGETTDNETYEPYISESFPLSLKSRNLFDKDNANIIKCGISYNKINASDLNRLLYISIQPNTTYTIQRRNDGNVNRFRAGTCSIVPANGVDLDNAIETDNAESITIMSRENDTYLVVMYYRTQETTLTEQQILDSIQIEENSIPTDYEPYYDIELCNISNYKDQIYSQNGKFYLEKKNGKVVFDGSENWTINTSYTYNVFYRTLGNYARISNTQTTYCEYYKGIENAGGIADFGNNYNNSIGVRTANDNIKDIYISNNSITSARDFKIWLSTHNTVVYYVLATPTTTEITQENYPTLYSQLLAIQEFLTKYKINKEFLLDYSSPEIEY